MLHLYWSNMPLNNWIGISKSTFKGLRDCRKQPSLFWESGNCGVVLRKEWVVMPFYLTSKCKECSRSKLCHFIMFMKEEPFKLWNPCSPSWLKKKELRINLLNIIKELYSFNWEWKKPLISERQRLNLCTLSGVKLNLL